MKTYECSICYGVNHVSRFHCATCGTIPAHYSWTGEPIRERLEDFDISKPINSTVTVHVAFGCERQMSHRTVKRLMRTVPLDYYASE